MAIQRHLDRPRPLLRVPAVGDKGFVAIHDQPVVWMTADEKTQDEWARSLLDNDFTRITAMRQEQRLFSVPNNTPATIVDVGPVYCRVQLNGGGKVGSEAVTVIPNFVWKPQ